MAKKDLTLSSKALIWLLAAEDVIAPWISYREMTKAIRYGRRNTFDVAVHRLYQKGWIKFVDKEGERFLKLTKNGQIEALLSKAKIPKKQAWDGKWRIIVFDIPESAKEKRNLLRTLLKRNNFKRLQNSVYINPYPLNREAIRYLKETKLTDFIRIFKVEEMDEDTDLKKKFNLK